MQEDPEPELLASALDDVAISLLGVEGDRLDEMFMQIISCHLFGLALGRIA